MRRSTSVPLLAAAVAASLLTVTPPSLAAGPPAPPGPLQQGREGVLGNGAERSTTAATTGRGYRGSKRTGVGPEVDRAYPRRSTLTVPAVNEADASLKLGLVPYHALAGRLNDLQRRSDRVSIEVIGTSTQGRELYLVTVTAPESLGQVKQQTALRRQIEQDPVAAAKDEDLVRRYKAPFLVNGNIHGNEWEGTDGILKVVEELATATDAETAALLQRTRVYAVLSVNPDGRVNGTRANAAGFDMNRDFITGSQPEVVATRQLIMDAQPLVFVDMHGYVAKTLIEPATAPHGDNYEYDLYIKHALPNAQGMERLIEGSPIPDAAAGEIDPVIPFRDYAPGEWDDWPPIFTPMYSIFHGAVGHTIEFPLRVNNASYTTLPVEELRRRARVNVEVTVRSVKASLAYTDAQRAALVADQIEVFRRGTAGEQRREVPLQFVEGFGAEDQGYTTEFPRAYVVPAVEGQRSPAAAARLVDHLVANDVRVTRADRPFTLAGRRYPAGSYVVDMHQPKRGLANVMLEAGEDITARVPQMYDISGWSHRLLWGASVDVVRDGALSLTGTRVRTAAPTGALEAASGDLALRLVDAKDVAAVNALLAEGVALRWTEGAVVVPASARAAAQRVATTYGVRLTAAPAGESRPLGQVTVAAAAAADELKVLRDLGFDVRPVSTALANAGFDWTGVEALFVSSGLSYPDVTGPARTALDAFLERGAVVTRGTTGATFNEDAGLLQVTAVRGNRSANGVVSVTNSGGPVTAGALPHSFIYSPLWFTGLGAGVASEQTYGDLVAGHWRTPPTPPGDTTGQPGGAAQALGQASVVRGIDERGTSVVLFGTEPMFRDHPKGLYSQVARALFHTALTAS